MRTLGRILFFIVLAAAAGAAGTFVAMLIANNGMPRALNSNLLLPLTIQAIAVLIFFSFSVFVFVKVFRLALRWLKWNSAQSNASKTTSLICFAIAVYFFPRPISFIFYQGWAFISEVLNSFPNLVLQSTPVESICASSQIEYCIGALTKTMLNGWNIFVLNAIGRLRLDQFPLLDAIFLSALWLGLANIVSRPHFIGSFMANVRSFFSGLTENYKSISPKFRANALFVGILFIGAYLSFSSVIAIPSLQDALVQDAHKPEELRNRLQGVALTKDKFDAHFPDISTPPVIQATAKTTADANPKGSSSQSGAKLPDQAPGGTAKTTDEGTSTEGAPQASVGMSVYLPFLEKNASRRFATLRSNWNGLRENFRSNQLTVIDLATEVFDFSNRGRKGVRETQQHFLGIDLWYRRWWAERASALSACRAAIEKFGADVGDLVDLIEANLRIQSSSSSFRDSDLGEFTKRQNNSEERAQSTCAISDSADYDIPLREDFGRYLGVFGIATLWLLKTESLSLVLITGLLGFGLLGAACSTFIRTVGKRSPDDPLVLNLTGVILRGASAAMMIFLGVYGGLAVFAGPNASPNPYVVLFACLVAAVYSEDAWAWGLREFNSRLGEGQPAPGKTGSTSATDDGTGGGQIPESDSKPISSGSPGAGYELDGGTTSSAGGEVPAARGEHVGEIAGESAAEAPPESGSRPPSSKPPLTTGLVSVPSETSTASDEVRAAPSETPDEPAGGAPRELGRKPAPNASPEAGSARPPREPPLEAGEPAAGEPSRVGDETESERSEASGELTAREPPRVGGSVPSDEPRPDGEPSTVERTRDLSEPGAGSHLAERPADEGGRKPPS